MKEASVQLSDNFVFDDENKTIGWGGSCEVRQDPLQVPQEGRICSKEAQYDL